MTDISGELLDAVHSAGACLVDIRALAGKLAPLSAEQLESLLLGFVDDGEDQALLRDASQYTGTTWSELKNKPGLVDDPDVIYNMRAYELKRLTPSELGENQLFTGYQRALDYGQRELAFDMLVEYERRPGEREFDRGHFEDLITRVLEAGDLALARKIRDHCGEHTWYPSRSTQ